jgi:hypothetical protein
MATPAHPAPIPAYVRDGDCYVCRHCDHVSKPWLDEHGQPHRPETCPHCDYPGMAARPSWRPQDTRSLRALLDAADVPTLGDVIPYLAGGEVGGVRVPTLSEDDDAPDAA